MQAKEQYKCLTLLAMLYMTIKLIMLILIYKVITIGPFLLPASTFEMPLWFMIGDIIAEVYGIKIAKNIIWMAIFCQFIFAFSASGLSSLHSPDWINQKAYNQVIGNLPRVAVSSFLAIASSAFINAYAISKWKILLKGQYFWLRSLGASAIGELVFTIVAYASEFWGVATLSTLGHLIILGYLFKIAINSILVIPAMSITFILKKLEGVDIYDYGIKFNPFAKLQN